MPYISEKEHEEYVSLKSSAIKLGMVKGLDIDFRKARHVFQREKLDKIVMYLAYRFNIQITDVLRLHKRRDKEYTYPRHILMYMIDKYYDISLVHIGRQFVNKYDHSSIIHGINAIKDLVTTNNVVAREIKDICAYIEFKVIVDEDLSELLQLKLEI